MVDAAATAEFVYHFYSRILADPIVDGHNRVLLAYMGLGTWNGRDCLEEGKKCDSLYPDAECELGSTWVDSTGKVYGQTPSENGKAPPLTNYRLPCIRDLHHGRRGGGEVETEGDREATSSDGVFREYNFSAVVQWANHDYPLMYTASLKPQNYSHSWHNIKQAQTLVVQQDPMDIRLGVYMYNPHTETVVDLEVQIRRTFGTSHRTVSASLYSYAFYGRDSGYYQWGGAVILCFIVHCILYLVSSWRSSKFTASYKRARSDYTWKRWQAVNADEDFVAPDALRFAESASCCCNFNKGVFHWGTVELIALFVQYFNCNLIRSFMGISNTLWEQLPPANSAEDLTADYLSWQTILAEAKSGTFGPNAAHAMHIQMVCTGLYVLLCVVLLLRDLAWHEGVGVLASTLRFAAKDLQDILLVSALLIFGFSAFATAAFGGFGAQDRFTTFRQSAESLSLLGFGKTVNYDTVVNDDLGIRFNGVGMGPAAAIKPVIFWVMLFLFIFVIPNIILAIIVEGFERHVDVANQRVKVTLLQLIRRRVYLLFWKLRDRVRPSKSQMPKWARQMSVASTPAALAVLDGLTNPMTSAVLPIEIRDQYLLSRSEEEIRDEVSNDEVKSQKAKQREHRFFYRITTAEDLLALLRFGVEHGSGSCSDEELTTLCQQVWQLYSKDTEGKGWAETVAEDHSDELGSTGNHVRIVVRNELRSSMEPLAERLSAMEQRLESNDLQMQKVIEMLSQLSAGK